MIDISAAQSRPARASLFGSQGMGAALPFVVLLIALGLLVALPEALGDHPYDPRPSRVLHL